MTSNDEQTPPVSIWTFEPPGGHTNQGEREYLANVRYLRAAAEAERHGCQLVGKPTRTEMAHTDARYGAPHGQTAVVYRWATKPADITTT